MDRPTPQQLTDDREFVLNLIRNDLVIVDAAIPERKQSVIAILRRQQSMGGRRGGTTRADLINLNGFCPGEQLFGPNASKAEIIVDMLRRLGAAGENEAEDREDDRENAENQVDGHEEALAPPAGPPPAGWNVPEQVVPRAVQVHDALLRRRRGLLRDMPVARQLSLLLDEQDAVEAAQIGADAPTLLFARQNLQQMTANPVPLPAEVADEWVWYFYKAELAKEIDVLSREENERAVIQEQRLATATAVPSSDRVVDLRREEAEEDEGDKTSSSSSDSDLASYAPKKRFALKQYRPSKKEKRKRKRKKKRSKKKRRRHSSSSSEDSSDSDLADGSNARRASGKAHNDLHLQQLQEFKETYADYERNAVAGKWPDEDALKFMTKKFCRPGSLFMDKTKGVMHKFAAKSQRDTALERTKLVYAMANTVAEHRLDRNEELARYYRRAKGASEAKAARIRQQASKYKRASVREEQTLLANLSTCCDLILMGSKSWDEYHYQLKLGGQTAAIIESTGGVASKSVAQRAWKAASASAVATKRPKKGPLNPKTECYWCRGNHSGRQCPRLRAGEKCHPASKAASWKPEDRENLIQRRSKKPKIKVEKP